MQETCLPLFPVCTILSSVVRSNTCVELWVRLTQLFASALSPTSLWDQDPLDAQKMLNISFKNSLSLSFLIAK